MFKSSGYFRGLPCPYFAAGLCERPYCHYRHTQSANSLTSLTAHAQTDEVVTQEDTPAHGKKIPPTTSRQEVPPKRHALLNVVGDAIKRIEYDIEKDRAKLNVLKSKATELAQIESVTKSNLPSHLPSVYKPTPIRKKPQSRGSPARGSSTTAKASSPKGIEKTYNVDSPDYIPTPRSLLLARQNDDSNEARKKRLKEDSQYDPIQNYSTRCDYKPKTRPPNPDSYFTREPSPKRIKIDLPEVEIEAKFSDEEEMMDTETPSEAVPNTEGTESQDQLKSAETASQGSSQEDNDEVSETQEEASQCEVPESETEEGENIEMKTEETQIEKMELKSKKPGETTSENSEMATKKTKEDRNIFERMWTKDNIVSGVESEKDSEIEENGCEVRSIKGEIPSQDDNSFSKLKSSETGTNSEVTSSPKSLCSSNSSDVVVVVEKQEKLDIIKIESDEDTNVQSGSEDSDGGLEVISYKKGRVRKNRNLNNQEDTVVITGVEKPPEVVTETTSKSTSDKDKQESRSKSHKKKSKKHKHRSSSKDKHRHSEHRSSSKEEKSSSKLRSSSKDKSSSHRSSSRHSSSSSKHSSSKPRKDHESSRHRSSSHKSSSHRSSSSKNNKSSHRDSERKSSSSGKSSQKESEKISSSTSKSKDLEKRASKSRASLQKQASHQIVDLFGKDSDTELSPDEDVIALTSDSESPGHEEAAEVIESADEISDQDDNNLQVDFEEEDPYDECLKIFNEANKAISVKKEKEWGQKTEEKPTKDDDEEEEEVQVGKKRVAHHGKQNTMEKRKKQLADAPMCRPSPAQVMHNRMLQIQKKALEMANSKNDRDKTGPFSPSPSAGRVRIPAPKVFLDKPASLIKQAQAASKDDTGPTYTSKKFQKRVAHTPAVSTVKRPTIPAEFGSKVPINIRQRYLNLIIDECLKLNPTEMEAYEMALTEEKAVYARSTNKKVYLNVAINAIKKLRSEIAQLNPKASNSSTGKMTVSHEAMLGGSRAANTSYSLGKSRLARNPSKLEGGELYKRLLGYKMKPEELIDNSYPHFEDDSSGEVKIKPRSNTPALRTENERLCVRCGQKFFVNSKGEYVKEEECTFHWGKAWKRKIAGAWEMRYTCCSGDFGAQGCSQCKYHVHEYNKYSDLKGYQKTLPSSPRPDGNHGIYSLDCEMVYTSGGQELARVTVIDTNCKQVFDKIVRPKYKILDYNTRFSGLTELDMMGVETSLRDVQAVLLSMFNDKSILIGHSLESDLLSLKLVHSTVVDTSIVFPHRQGPPYKRALRTLMAEFCKKIIQNDVGGHDSSEDAVSCMELMLWKVKEDAKLRKDI